MYLYKIHDEMKVQNLLSPQTESFEARTPRIPKILDNRYFIQYIS